MDTSNFLFVKTDLFLQEITFNALRDFVNSGEETINMYSLEYDVEKDKVICTPYDSLFKFASLAHTTSYLADGYMLISLNNLKKLLGVS